MVGVSTAAVPQPRSQAEAAARAGRGAAAGRLTKLSLAAGLLFAALGAALVLLASGRTWAEGNAAFAQGDLRRTVDGQDITGLPGALAIVGLAALVAVFAVRGLGRYAVAGILALCGVGTAVGSLLALDDTAALEAKAAETTGITDTAIHGVTYTPWPWAAFAGGVLIFLAGLLALGYGRAWPAMSGRYERAGGDRPRRGRPAPDPDRPEELWKALDRGEDPTGRES
ncbi:TIGR02234 family membrane protein [Streptomyces sp. AC563]|uniref:TIGR02234 family membrane protein n=1 Tax=Streptomyces buecherae TaxID=2763006 RepID=UPI00164D2C79|nr:TIGR02234 family membrane protein [Streptomyces buecherae]MBC3990986.1 TIGR02234 family membrane protein [Streptomyces buecherae]